MPTCVYCREPTLGTEPPEHPIPEALGAPFTLVPGDACLPCNNYVAQLDRALCDQPHLAAMAVATGILGKRGKIRTVLTETKAGTASLDPRTLSATLLIRDPALVGLSAGSLRPTFPPAAEFDDWRFSRALVKLGLGLLAHQFGAAVALESQFDRARQYVRQPVDRTVWPYLQRMSDQRHTPSSLRAAITSEGFHFRIELSPGMALVYMNFMVDEFVAAFRGDLCSLTIDQFQAIAVTAGTTRDYLSSRAWLIQPGARPLHG